LTSEKYYKIKTCRGPEETQINTKVKAAKEADTASIRNQET